MKNWIVKDHGECFCKVCHHAVDQADLNCWYCDAVPQTITSEEADIVAQHARGCAQKWYREYAESHPGEGNIFRHFDTQKEFSDQLRKSPYAMVG